MLKWGLRKGRVAQRAGECSQCRPRTGNLPVSGLLTVTILNVHHGSQAMYPVSDHLFGRSSVLTVESDRSSHQCAHAKGPMTMPF